MLIGTTLMMTLKLWRHWSDLPSCIEEEATQHVDGAPVTLTALVMSSHAPWHLVVDPSFAL